MAKPKRLKLKGKFVIRNRKPNAKGEVILQFNKMTYLDYSLRLPTR